MSTPLAIVGPPSVRLGKVGRPSSCALSSRTTERVAEQPHETSGSVSLDNVASLLKCTLSIVPCARASRRPAPPDDPSAHRRRRATGRAARPAPVPPHRQAGLVGSRLTGDELADAVQTAWSGDIGDGDTTGRGTADGPARRRARPATSPSRKAASPPIGTVDARPGDRVLRCDGALVTAGFVNCPPPPLPVADPGTGDGVRPVHLAHDPLPGLGADLGRGHRGGGPRRAGRARPVRGDDGVGPPLRRAPRRRHRLRRDRRRGAHGRRPPAALPRLDGPRRERRGAPARLRRGVDRRHPRLHRGRRRPSARRRPRDDLPSRRAARSR